MIRVTIELVSAVHPSRDRILGVAEICNEGTGASDADLFADYGVRLDDDSNPLETYTVKLSKRAPKERETWRRGRVEQFPRKVKGAWDLLYLALRAVIGDRNP